MIFYELRDKTTDNLLGSYDERSEALAAARNILLSDLRNVDFIALEWGEDEEETAGEVIASGHGLLMPEAGLQLHRPRDDDQPGGKLSFASIAAKRGSRRIGSRKGSTPILAVPGSRFASADSSSAMA